MHCKLSADQPDAMPLGLLVYGLAFQISLPFSISGHLSMILSPETGCVGSLGKSQVTIYSAHHIAYYGI